jgi:O-antigen/teichoic acid export membrane protein
VALTGDRPDGVPARMSLAALTARARAWLADGTDRSVAQRMAGSAFLIRVFSAGLAYLTQIALARWLGAFEFGIYVYVWTWVMLLGGAVDLGLASSAQRFIPQYRQAQDRESLHGFLAGSRWLAFGIATALSLAGLFAVYAAAPWLDDATLIPLAVACLCLPMYGLLHVQDGIARSFNWIHLALIPAFVIRQMLLLALLAGASVIGLRTDATTAIAAAALSIWLTAFGQTLWLNRSLASALGNGGKRYEIARWIAVSLPMFLVDGLYLLLMYVDVLMLKYFRTPEEIAVYYAGAKTLALVAFVYFAVSAASSHKFAEYFAAGDRAKLSAFLAETIRWTFWPTLLATTGILICGWPLLRLFGPQYVDAYGLMFVLAIGFLARAAVGPGERFLNMLGEQKLCAAIVAVAFLINLAAGLALIPPLGIMGAAISTTAAFVVESALIFLVAKRRLGYHLFIVGGKAG